MKKKIIYALRWQAAFIIYYPCIKYIGSLWGTILAALIGAVIFFKIDQFLTKKNGKNKAPF